MKNNLIILGALLALLLGVWLGYRGYLRHKVESEQAALALSRDIAGRERLAALRRRAATEAEAHRLAELQARREIEEAANRLAQLQAGQLAAETDRLAAEQEAARMSAELERLRIEKEAAQGEARQLAEIRAQEAAAANAARLAALDKLRTQEREKIDQVEREAARLVALRRQAELEALAYRRAAPADRIIYPADYKPREHHNLRATLEWETYRKAGATVPPLPPPDSGATAK